MTELPVDTVLLAPTPDDVKAVADEIRTGNCMLFIGAGVHSAPPPGSPYQYDDALRPLRGGELAKHLAGFGGYDKAFPHEQPTNLGRISLYTEMKKSRGPLVDQVRDKVQNGKRASPALRGLAALDFRFIATTNYDQLFEEALRAAGKTPYISFYKSDRNQATDDFVGEKQSDDPSVKRPFVLKVHGDIDHPESLVITDEDYIQFLLRMGDQRAFNPVPSTFLPMFANKPTLFIGYSLLDYNLRLLFKTLRWLVDNARIATAYSVDPYPDQIIRDVYDPRFVKFIVLDVWSFVPMLYRELKGEEMPQ